MTMNIENQNAENVLITSVWPVLVKNMIILASYVNKCIFF